MEGEKGSLERGTPGFMPDANQGRDLEISSWEAELRAALTPYDCRLDELPSELQNAIRARQAFTIVEGLAPVNVYRGKLDVEDLIHKLLRHDQSTLAVQQLRLYAVHNGRFLNQHRPLELDPVPPHPGFEQPIVHEIPEELPDDNGRLQSTTLDGTRPHGRTVPKLTFEWTSNDRHVIEFAGTDAGIARGKGRTTISIAIAGTSIRSREIPVEVWNVDHVLLTPRILELPLGKRKQILAEVTNDEGSRATNVLLNWKHDADDPLIVRINPAGWVTGNRRGRTNISAGAGDPDSDGVWARIPAEVIVVETPDEILRGSGFPQLLLTGRDSDPESGEIRDGDPEQPALWQEVSDYRNNVWWLNLENPAAFFHFNSLRDRPELWRSFHAQKVVEMVQQVHMQTEYTQRDADERPDFWASHKAAMERIEVQFAQMMWEQLNEYVQTGSGID